MAACTNDPAAAASGPQFVFERSRLHWGRGSLTVRAHLSEGRRHNAEPSLWARSLTVVDDFAHMMICGLTRPLEGLLLGGPGSDTTPRGGGHAGKSCLWAVGQRTLCDPSDLLLAKSVSEPKGAYRWQSSRERILKFWWKTKIAQENLNGFSFSTCDF